MGAIAQSTDNSDGPLRRYSAPVFTNAFGQRSIDEVRFDQTLQSPRIRTTGRYRPGDASGLARKSGLSLID